MYIVWVECTHRRDLVYVCAVHNTHAAIHLANRNYLHICMLWLLHLSCTIYRVAITYQENYIFHLLVSVRVWEQDIINIKASDYMLIVFIQICYGIVYGGAPWLQLNIRAQLDMLTTAGLVEYDLKYSGCASLNKRWSVILEKAEAHMHNKSNNLNISL